MWHRPLLSYWLKRWINRRASAPIEAMLWAGLKDPVFPDYPYKVDSTCTELIPPTNQPFGHQTGNKGMLNGLHFRPTVCQVLLTDEFAAQRVKCCCCLLCLKLFLITFCIVLNRKKYQKSKMIWHCVTFIGNVWLEQRWPLCPAMLSSVFCSKYWQIQAHWYWKQGGIYIAVG